jgi:hypothetical protein
MQRVRINAGMVGLVFKNDNYARVITEGMHWISFREHLVKYDLSQPFNAPKALEILLKDEALANMLTVVDVKDNEIVLAYLNDNFQRVLSPGRHTFWNSLLDYKFVKADRSKIEIPETISRTLYGNMLLRHFIRTFEVAAYEKAIMLVDDEYVKILDHGVYHF